MTRGRTSHLRRAARLISVPIGACLLVFLVTTVSTRAQPSRDAGAADATAHSRAQAERKSQPGSRRSDPPEAAEAPAPIPPPSMPILDAHQGIVTLAAGEAEGSDVDAAADIRSALASAGVRVAPVLDPDVSNQLRSLADSPLIDVAFARLDELEAVRAKVSDLPMKLGFVARLFNEEIAIAARPGLNDATELEGRKVGVGPKGSSSEASAHALFARLGIHPTFVAAETGAALSALDRGELDAVVLVDAKPAPQLFLPRAEGVHILSIPYGPTLQDLFYPAQLTHRDYPKLVPQTAVDTLAVATFLVAPLAPVDAVRRKRIDSFVRAFLSSLPSLQAPGRQPKWREVNLAADAPGWTRLPEADHWLAAADDADKKAFDAYLAQRHAPPPSTEADRRRMFQEFVMWNSLQAR